MARKKSTKWEVPSDYRDIISKGQVIKNFKEFCGLMGWKPSTGGNGKASQFKEIDRHFEYYKEGYSYIITKVLDEPLPAIDLRSGNTNVGIYSESIDAILLTTLANAEGENGVLILTKVQWLEIIGAVNNYYLKCRNTIGFEEASDNMKISQMEIRDTMFKIEKNIWQSFKGVLNRLVEEKLIIFEDVVVFYNKDDHEDFRNKKTTDFMQYNRYREIFKDELYKVGCSKEYELYGTIDENTGKPIDVKSFYRKLAGVVNREFGWGGHYRAVKVGYTKRQVKRHLTDSGLSEEKFNLNTKIIVKAMEQAKARQSKSLESIYDLEDEETVALISMGFGDDSYEDIGMTEDELVERDGMSYYIKQDSYIPNVSNTLNTFSKIDGYNVRANKE